MDDKQCNICDKYYSSYKSLWNHNYKYHRTIPTILPQKSTICKNVPTILPQKSTFQCCFCKKILSRNDSLKRHELICKKNKNPILEINELKIENEIIKKNYDDLNYKFNELLKLCKIHPKTLQKINKTLINNNINNGTINNINIVKFGSEDLSSLLSHTEVLDILNKKMQSLEESIKIIHFNNNRKNKSKIYFYKYEELLLQFFILEPELKNIYITNLKDQYAYIYDGLKFTAVLKKDVLSELVDNHFENLELSIEEYKDQLPYKTACVLDKFIEMMNDEEEEFNDTEHNKTYPNYKNFKVNQIKLMIYNETDHKTNVVNVICER
jgi:hypothetical protein